MPLRPMSASRCIGVKACFGKNCRMRWNKSPRVGSDPGWGRDRRPARWRARGRHQHRDRRLPRVRRGVAELIDRMSEQLPRRLPGQVHGQLNHPIRQGRPPSRRWLLIVPTKPCTHLVQGRRRQGLDAQPQIHRSQQVQQRGHRHVAPDSSRWIKVLALPERRASSTTVNP